MKKLFLTIIFILLSSKYSYAYVCDEVSLNWNLYEKKNYATFTFKSNSSKTVKIYDLQLLTGDSQVITTLGEEFYVKPFNVVKKDFFIGNLNQGVIKTASRKCVHEEKKTGTQYTYGVKWKNTSTMAYNDCGITGLLCEAWIGVRTDTNSVGTGGKMTVYDKNGNKIETFKVQKILIDYDKKQCWVSKENKEKFKDYLSIQNCTEF